MPGGSLWLPEPQSWVGAAARALQQRLCPPLLAARALCRAPHPAAPSGPEPQSPGPQERPVRLAQLARDRPGRVSECLQVPCSHGSREGALGSGTSRKTKLIKLLLLRLKEETAREPVPGDSMKP